MHPLVSTLDGTFEFIFHLRSYSDDQVGAYLTVDGVNVSQILEKKIFEGYDHHLRARPASPHKNGLTRGQTSAAHKGAGIISPRKKILLLTIQCIRS